MGRCRSREWVVLVALAGVWSCSAAAAPDSLDEALGRPAGVDFAAERTAHEDQHARIELLIAECMGAQGFEYRPGSLPPDPRADENLTAEEYRQQYGYGMLRSSEGSILGEQGWVEPNEELRASMDELTHLAWQAALYGEDPFDHETRDGCRDQAEDEINAYRFTDEWAELEPRLDELEARIAADPRTVAAQSRWVACMARAGYDVADQDEAIRLIDELIFAAFESEPLPPGADPVDNRYEVEPWFVATETWQELIEIELDIAAHDEACSEDVGVREEYEQRFLDDHADLLERVRSVR